MIEFERVKQLMLTKPMVCESVFFVITVIFLNFPFQSEVCNGCHNLIQKFMSFPNVKLTVIKFLFF